MELIPEGIGVPEPVGRGAPWPEDDDALALQVGGPHLEAFVPEAPDWPFPCAPPRGGGGRRRSGDPDTKPGDRDDGPPAWPLSEYILDRLGLKDLYPQTPFAPGAWSEGKPLVKRPLLLPRPDGAWTPWFEPGIPPILAGGWVGGCGKHLTGTMTMPAFATLGNPDTAKCFSVEFGGLLLSDWPATDCCEPALNPRPCILPDSSAVSVQRVEADPDYTGGTQPFPLMQSPLTVDEIAGMEAIYARAIALLRQEADVVEWILCLIQDWSPGMATRGYLKDCVMGLILGDGAPCIGTVDGFTGDPTLKLVVVHVLVPTGAEGGAYMMVEPAYDGSTIAVVLPARHPNWQGMVADHVGVDPERALLSVINAAAIILHEIVHIVGNGVIPSEEQDKDPPLLPDEEQAYLGADHSGKELCWHEAIMAANTLVWAMGMRYPCLANSGVSTNVCLSDVVDGLFLSSAKVSTSALIGPAKCG